MTVLCVGSHPDDIELGCGGVIGKLREQKAKVFGYVATRHSVRFVKLGMCGELREAWKQLGISEVEASQNFKPREFDRQKLLDELIKVRNYVQPDLVFTHGSSDNHQDHSTVHEESKRAFKHSSIMGYSFQWNEVHPNNNRAYYSLLESHVDNKLKALSYYKTQKHRSYFNLDYQRSLLVSMGMAINKPFAEAFEVIRLIN